jgi:3-oxoacyl-(acyl-carrier-protein) synthase III
MYAYTQGHSRIMGIGVYIPEDRITTRQLLKELDAENRFGISCDWLERVMGIREKRIVPPDMLPSDMATKAAREALEIAALRPIDIDVVIYAGVDRDFLWEPATAHIVQHSLGAYNAIVFDVSNACHGFMNGIHLMDALIATGQARRGLIVTGEKGSTATRMAIDALRGTNDRATFEHLAGGFSVGDAGAAMIVGPKQEPESGFMGFMLQSQGQHANLCTFGKNGQESSLNTDMVKIVEEHVALLALMYDGFMKKLGWQPEDITRFVHHQVGRKVFKLHAKYARIPLDIMTNTISTMGNLVSASIPVNLYKLQKDACLATGDKVFIAGAGSGLSVSQAGLVWKAA